MKNLTVVGKAGFDCSLGEYNALTSKFNNDKFNECFTGKLSVSDKLYDSTDGHRMRMAVNMKP